MYSLFVEHRPYVKLILQRTVFAARMDLAKSESIMHLQKLKQQITIDKIQHGYLVRRQY